MLGMAFGSYKGSKSKRSKGVMGLDGFFQPLSYEICPGNYFMGEVVSETRKRLSSARFAS